MGLGIIFLRSKNIAGDHAERATPVPIPNTVVKPLRADGSVVGRLCESRSVLLKIARYLEIGSGLFLCSVYDEDPCS